MTKHEIEVRLKLLDLEQEQIQIQMDLALYKSENQIEFFEPLKHQDLFLDYLHQGKKTILLQGSNQIGKTITGCVICGAACLGYEPWSGEPTVFGKPPIKVRIVCSDWEHHAKEVIVPKLKEWLPKNRYTTKKNNVGVEAYFNFDNGSTLELLTHVQDTKAHESWTGHLVWADEPIPRDKYVANKRGLLFNNGVFLLTMTAVYEPWIKNELVDKPNKNVGLVCGVKIEENTYLSESAIEEFKNSCTDEDRAARTEGGWLQLSGRIIPGFHTNTHTIDPIIEKVPSDWPVIALVDTHLKLPHAISYFALDKYNRLYLIKETWEALSPEDIADEIIRTKQRYFLRLENAFLDPLSKGDTEFIKRHGQNVPDTFTTVSLKLYEAGIRTEVASKDKKSGIANIKAGFKKDPRLSTIFISRDCTTTIEELNNWVYDPKTNKPKDENDHFCENLYRATLSGIKYTSVSSKDDYQTESYGVV